MTLKIKTITSIVVTAILVVISVFVYVYVVNTFLNQSQNNADNRVLIETENKRIYDVSMLRQQVVVAQAQQEKINQYFLRKDQIAPFLGFLESIGTDTGSLITIGSVDIEKGTKSNKLNVHFKVSGTYQQVMAAEEKYEQIPFYSEITKIVLDIVPDSGGGIVSTITGKDGKPVQVTSKKNTPLWSADITMVVYSFTDTIPLSNNTKQ